MNEADQQYEVKDDVASISYAEYLSRGFIPSEFVSSYPESSSHHHNSYIMNSAISIPSLEVDRGFLDSFVEVLPTTSDFQALFYSTGAKFAADVVAAEPASEPIVESSSASIPEVPTIARTSPPTMVASVPPHVAPMHSFALPFHPHHAPASYAAFLGRPGLTNLDPEWQRREVALQKLQAATAVMQPPVVVPSIHSTEVISNSLAATVPIISANSSQQPVVPTAVPEHKPHTKNLSAAAKERRRERNKVLARKTRQKKKVETESLRDRLIALMVENEKLKRAIKTNIPEVAIKDVLNTTNDSIPDNIQTLVQQMIVANQRALWGEITSKQRSFCISNPQLPDCPIVFVSPGFLELTGYTKEECIGRNCRFLQGPATDRAEIDRMREALRQHQDITAVVLNYTKKGDSFWNKIEISHLCDENNNIRFIVGVQNKCDAQYIRTRIARHRSMSAWSQGDESSETTRNTLDKNSSSNDLSGHVSSATMDYGCTEEALDESKRENKKRFRNINNNKNNNNNNNRSNQSVGETTTNSSSSSSPSSNLEEQSVMHTTQITSSN